MDMTTAQPEPIPNLIQRVRADGMKIFHPQAREQLLTQARLGQHSVAALAQINVCVRFSPHCNVTVRFSPHCN
jgi:hypothetical protein